MVHEVNAHDLDCAVAFGTGRADKCPARNNGRSGKNAFVLSDAIDKFFVIAKADK